MVAALLAGCAPHVRIEELHAADLELPAAVRVVAARGDDSPGAIAAVDGFVRTVGGADGLSVGEPGDATVSFGAFHAEASTAVDHRTEREGDDVRTVYTARRTVTVAGTIRLVAADGSVLDTLEDTGTFDTWEADGDDPAAAEAALPPLEDLERRLGASTGVAYARRVAPLWDGVTRRWYATGDPRFAAVSWQVRRDDWGEARRVWREVADDPEASATARARALYDLAVSYEVDGEVRRAWLAAGDAAEVSDRRPFTRYRDALDELRADHRPLMQEMALPEDPGERTGGGDG